jgi:hypothetical protein
MRNTGLVTAGDTNISTFFFWNCIAALIPFNWKVTSYRTMLLLSYTKPTGTFDWQIFWAWWNVARTHQQITVCCFICIWIYVLSTVSRERCRACCFVRDTIRPLASNRSSWKVPTALRIKITLSFSFYLWTISYILDTSRSVRAT